MALFLPLAVSGASVIKTQACRWSHDKKKNQLEARGIEDQGRWRTLSMAPMAAIRPGLQFFPSDPIPRNQNYQSPIPFFCLHALFPISNRFGLRQKHKIRLIDDFSESSVNQNCYGVRIPCATHCGCGMRSFCHTGSACVPSWVWTQRWWLAHLICRVHIDR